MFNRPFDGLYNLRVAVVLSYLQRRITLGIARPRFCARPQQAAHGGDFVELGGAHQRGAALPPPLVDPRAALKQHLENPLLAKASSGHQKREAAHAPPRVQPSNC